MRITVTTMQTFPGLTLLLSHEPFSKLKLSFDMA